MLNLNRLKRRFRRPLMNLWLLGGLALSSASAVLVFANCFTASTEAVGGEFCTVCVDGFALNLGGLTPVWVLEPPLGSFPGLVPFFTLLCENLGGMLLCSFRKHLTTRLNMCAANKTCMEARVAAYFACGSVFACRR